MATSLSRKTLNGVWPALIIPWTDDDRVDEKRFEKECLSYANTGVQGIYTGGTTGEFYAQDDASFEVITRIACDAAHASNLFVQIGCTAESTLTARRRVRTALKHKADGIQIALPYWLELTPAEAIDFMKDIAKEAGDTPLILYHTGRAKMKLKPEAIGQLAGEVPSFIGMKDTGCDLPTLKEMVALAPDIAIFGGEDFYERIPLGGRGGYCSITGLNTRYVVEYYNLCAAGKFDQAKRHHEVIKRLLDEALLPLNRNEGLWDSAIDRVQRQIGGGDVGLRCQPPYRSATQAQVDKVRQWCQANAPELLKRA